MPGGLGDRMGRREPKADPVEGFRGSSSRKEDEGEGFLRGERVKDMGEGEGQGGNLQGVNSPCA
jgi:hypothetical protein